MEALLEKKLPDGRRHAHGTPLWLELALQEISLLEADDFERAERTFGEAFTRAAISFVALGRFGWRESDLQALVPARTGASWDELAFAGVRRSPGHHLVQRGEAGLWTFFHAQLRETAFERYLPDSDRRHDLHRRLADHLQSLSTGDILRNSETMIHLVRYEDQQRAALYLAECQASSWKDERGGAELSGAVAALIWSFENEKEPHARDRLTKLIAGLLIGRRSLSRERKQCAFLTPPYRWKHDRPLGYARKRIL